MSLKKKIEKEMANLNVIKVIKASLTGVIFNIVQEHPENFVQILPTIKDILLDVVDEVWKIFDRMDNSRLKYFEEFEKDKDKESFEGSTSRKKIVRNQNKRDLKSVDLRAKYSESQIENSYSRGASFSRSIREINKRVETTPGPSSYSCSKNSIISNPPRTIFPLVTKRDSYIPISLSPGPAKYSTPLKKITKS